MLLNKKNKRTIKIVLLICLLPVFAFGKVTINGESQSGGLTSGSVLGVHISATNALGESEDNYLISFDFATGKFTWVPQGSGSGDLLANGETPLTANWDIGPYYITGTRFISDIAIGTSPFAVTSTTVCTNLNADLLDDLQATAFGQLGEISTITGNWVNTAYPWADDEVADDITLANISQITTKPITGLSATNWRLFYSADGGIPVELAFGADGTFLMSNGPSVAPTFETASGSGDITSVLGDTTGAVAVLFQDASTFTGADPHPDVSTATHWITADTTTYTDFDGTPVDGQQLWIYCAHAATFDLTASGIEAWNRTTDWTATVGYVAILIYEDDDNQWHFVNAQQDTIDIQFALSMEFEGSGADDAYEATISVINPVVDVSWALPFCKYDATTAPGVTNDLDEGFSVGSIWVDVTGDNSYQCQDATDGAAVWVQIDAGAVTSKTYSTVFAEPDQLQPISDAWLIKYFPAETYSSGVTIDAIHITTSATCTDVLNFEEWTQSGTTSSSTVESVTLSGTFTEDDGTLADASIAADGRLMVDLPASPTNIAFYEITVIYHAN